ncbi:MAG: flagellar FlbD family protein [bacterium]
MITVNRQDGSTVVINADLIEFVEAIPETIISLTTGRKIMVRRATDDIIDRVTQFKRQVRIKPLMTDHSDIENGSYYGK